MILIFIQYKIQVFFLALPEYPIILDFERSRESKDSYFYLVKKIGILNGPNLNLLGTREPELYGSITFEDYLKKLRSQFEEMIFEYEQSNVEGELINQLQTWNNTQDAVIINLGGYSHTSVSLADAVKALDIPVIEVHISNIYARESFRHQSLSGAQAQGCIMGLGLAGYTLAVQYLLGNHHGER